MGVAVIATLTLPVRPELVGVWSVVVVRVGQGSMAMKVAVKELIGTGAHHWKLF